jgi:hypothetical protein
LTDRFIGQAARSRKVRACKFSGPAWQSRANTKQQSSFSYFYLLLSALIRAISGKKAPQNKSDLTGDGPRCDPR